MRRVVQASLRWLPRDGSSLVEVVVALMLLAGGLVTVASGGSTVINQLKTSRTEVELWAALQTVGDSLQQLGHGHVTDGTRLVDQYSFSWSVESPVPNLNVITIAGTVTAPVVRRDTLLIYLADN